MDIYKINPWLAGIISVIAGSVLVYFEVYRNNQTIDFLSYTLIFLGWVALFIRITKGTSVHAEKIFFKDDPGGWFRQRFSNFIYYAALFGTIFGNIYCAFKMAQDRKSDILTKGLTNTATAKVAYIDVRHGRNSTSYYAVFQYTAGGKLFTHPWYEEQESDFLVGDKYVIKYSVEYPEMFVLTEKLP
jgi:hypothetical protein